MVKSAGGPAWKIAIPFTARPGMGRSREAQAFALVLGGGTADERHVDNAVLRGRSGGCGKARDSCIGDTRLVD